MKAGFYTADITPTIGMEQPGGYGKAYIQQFHDPLKVRAAVFEGQQATIALVGVDTCVLGSRKLIQEVREGIEASSGIPGGHLLIAASHTHSGGPMWEMAYNDYSEAPELIRKLVYDYSTASDPLYSDWVRGQIMTAVSEAYRRREDALIAIGSGYEDQVAFNRRFRMRNGRVYTHPGKGNPNIIGPAGPTDPEVGVIAAWSPERKLLGCVVNYSCHCTVFGRGVSADYVYYLEQTIQRGAATEAPVVFLNGACGDVTQVDNQSLRERESGEKWSRHVGTRLGAEVLKVLASTEPGMHTPLAAATRKLRLKRRPPSRESIVKSQQIVDKGLETGTFDTAWTFAKERLILDYMVQHEPEIETEIRALQFGQTLLVANAAEFFCGLGLEIKARSNFPRTYVVELANGCIGYVPTADAFEPTGGGYETVLSSYSNLEIGAGKTLVTAILGLAKELTPGKEPAPFGMPESPVTGGKVTPWSYGVLGPEID